MQSKKYTFHGIECEIYTDEHRLRYLPAFPWRFRIWRPDGTRIEFVGMPNYCVSRQSAMMRAKARCRWLANGSYDTRYS
jgi:hypothetical protein